MYRYYQICFCIFLLENKHTKGPRPKIKGCAALGPLSSKAFETAESYCGSPPPIVCIYSILCKIRKENKYCLFVDSVKWKIDLRLLLCAVLRYLVFMQHFFLVFISKYKVLFFIFVLISKDLQKMADAIFEESVIESDTPNPDEMTYDQAKEKVINKKEDAERQWINYWRCINNFDKTQETMKVCRTMQESGAPQELTSFM